MVLLVGAGNMAGAYLKVLRAQKVDTRVVGNSEATCRKFGDEHQCEVIRGGLRSWLETNQPPERAIVAVNDEVATETVVALIRAGVKRILAEKPVGLSVQELLVVSEAASKAGAQVLVAYNRRFYASTRRARELCAEDGGVLSCHFEFTEWSHLIEKAPKSDRLKQAWLLANSSHVLDQAFFLAGEPVETCSFASGQLSWHSAGAVFTGAGKLSTGALFSYHANWRSGGRWGIELMTPFRRLILKPLETLQVQKVGSVTIEPVAIDDSLDKEFKAGIYRQTEAFLNGKDADFLTVAAHLERAKWYAKRLVSAGDV